MTTVVTFGRFPAVSPIPVSHSALSAFYRLMEPLGGGGEYGVVGADEDEGEEEEMEWECPCMGGLSHCWRCDAPHCGCWEPDCPTCSTTEQEEYDEEIQLFTEKEMADLPPRGCHGHCPDCGIEVESDGITGCICSFL